MNSSFKSESPSWTQSLVMICEKCGKKLDSNKTLAMDTKNEWKKEFKDAGLWGPTRIVVTSCMDVCPVGEIAIARITDKKEVFTVKEKELPEFLEYLKNTERNI